MSRFLELKLSNGGQRRVRISTEAIRLISAAVVDRVTDLSSAEITTLVRGVGDSTSSMDEYLMFVLAQEVTRRVSSFSSSELLTVLETFCKRDLMDEDLFQASVDCLLPQCELSDLLSLLRNLSTLNFRHPGLTESVHSRIVEPSVHLSPKDVVNGIIGFTQLDMDVSSLWLKFEQRPNSPLSHDDQYRLIFAAMYNCPSNWAFTVLVPRIVQTCENRIRKRIALLLLAIECGLVPASPILLNELENKSSSFSSGSFPVSSGLHLEVASTLEGMMGSKFKLEVNCSGLIVDIVL